MSGILTDKTNKEWIANIPADDWRKNSTYLKDPLLPHTLAFLEDLKKIAAKHHYTLSQLAVAWVISQDITSAIVGARKPGQITETVTAAKWKMSKADLMEIDEVVNKYQKVAPKLFDGSKF